MDTGSPGIRTAAQCENVVSLLNHLRENHKDVSALQKLQKALSKRRKLLTYLKMFHHLEYTAVCKAYAIPDLDHPRGLHIHKKNHPFKNWK